MYCLGERYEHDVVIKVSFQAVGTWLGRHRTVMVPCQYTRSNTRLNDTATDTVVLSDDTS